MSAVGEQELGDLAVADVGSRPERRLPVAETPVPRGTGERWMKRQELPHPLHPAVLRLIHMTIQAGAKAGIPVSVCGEMAGDPDCARLLIGMGLRQFSMHPAQILEVKQEILRADAVDLTPKVQRLLKLDEPDRVREAVEKL